MRINTNEMMSFAEFRESWRKTFATDDETVEEGTDRLAGDALEEEWRDHIIDEVVVQMNDNLHDALIKCCQIVLGDVRQLKEELLDKYAEKLSDQEKRDLLRQLKAELLDKY